MYESRFAELFGPPPPSPPVPIDWAVTESRLGLRLPADYKAIASAYGPVDIGDRIWLHIPCTQPEGFDYGAWLREQHRWARISSRGAPPYEPPPFHPVPGGLLAWGSTRGTDLLFWDTSVSDDPDAWPVVVFCVDAMRAGVDPWRNFGMPLLETLAAAREGLDLPGGGRLGPLGRRVRRADLLLEAQPWTPPVPKPPRVPEHLQRTALAEGSGLETLRLLVPPPEQPVLGDGEWEQLFADLGTRLPEEYLAHSAAPVAARRADTRRGRAALLHPRRGGAVYGGPRARRTTIRLCSDWPPSISAGRRPVPFPGCA